MKHLKLLNVPVYIGMNRPFKVFAITLLTAASLTFIYFNVELATKTFTFTNKSVYNNAPDYIDVKPIIFLDWTLFFGKPLGHHNLEACPEWNCQLSTDRALLSQSSAVIFNLPDLKDNDLPKYRYADAITIFRTLN